MLLCLGFQQGAVISAQNITVMHNTKDAAIAGAGNHRQMLLARYIHHCQDFFQSVVQRWRRGMRVGYIAGIDQTVQTVVEGDVLQIGESNRADQFIGTIDHDESAVGQPAEHAFDFGDRGTLGYLVEILDQNILYRQGLQ